MTADPGLRHVQVIGRDANPTEPGHGVKADECGHSKCSN
jgi:hypothetical protein